MTHKLGMHWLRYHQDGRDLEHIERMQYRSIKPFQWMWNNRDFCRDLLTVLPSNAYILARDHPLSEQKEDVWRDPVGTGVRHANEWASKVSSGDYHLPLDRTFFLGINEPDATSGDRNAIDIYTASYLNRLGAHNLRGGAWSFSTGHPRTVDGTPHTPADYSVFERSHQAIVQGGHIGVAHIYGTTAVPLAPGHFDRLAACPWQDVEWVIGEFGIDEHVIGGGGHAGFHKGFEGRLHEYCGWIDRAIMGIEAVFSHIHDYELYTYDFSHPWDSFNVRDIREALESYDWQHAKQGNVQPDRPVVINPPSNGNPTAIVDAPAGANIRRGPGTDYEAIGVEAYGESLPIIGRNGDWWRVATEFGSGWVNGMIVKAFNVGSVPVVTDSTPSAPQPADKWEASYPFVLEIEGGLSLDPNDPGNWYKGQLVGTKYGISGAVWGGQYDIPNLTKEQALSIYRTHYWEASGADKLPWPMCLVVFDTAINHGVGVAQKLLSSQPSPEEIYLGQRALRYFDDPNWRLYGEAWGVRVGNLLDIVKERD